MHASTQTDRRAAEWLARREGDHWDGTQAAALEAWLAADTAHRVAFLRVQEAWEQAARLRALAPVQPAANGGGVSVMTPRPRPASTPARPRRWIRSVAGLAAVLVLGLGLAGAWWRSGIETADYRTALGKLDTVPLSDGSRATLGSDSRIHVRLDRGQRRVELTRGEGYFEVARDAARPFVVAVGDYRVVAVGTAFSVRRQGEELRVVVTEGTVRLEPGGERQGQPTLLPAGSVASTSGEGVLVRRQSLEEVARLVDWREGFLAFQDTSLAAAADEFNRYNARRLELGDPTAAALRVGGSFRWDNLETFVALLEAGFPVCAERREQAIVLHSAGAAACR
ncbi:FecR family protein [Arenimonas caeni]|jgi:transmembrane sensor|uniref:FecR family protein n=1 Tax=Arenimonas caeni TaxID=2058085 RepID=UPI002A35E480|nr:FecR domain-containing protein [Arenimonas caeni]MDY0022180.1 FecR domain-containing protein [Arenimonas caeni]